MSMIQVFVGIGAGIVLAALAAAGMVHLAIIASIVPLMVVATIMVPPLRRFAVLSVMAAVTFGMVLLVMHLGGWT